MGKEKKTHEVKEGNKPGTDGTAAQEEIRVLAYQLFCERGYAHGHDVAHWLESERRMLGQSKSRR